MAQLIEETFICTITRYADGSAYMKGFKQGQAFKKPSDAKIPQKGQNLVVSQEVKTAKNSFEVD